MPEPALPPQASPLLRALPRILRPLLRLLIRHGVTFPAFSAMLRPLYVRVAAEYLGNAASDSRLSLMTGVHRKEIRRLREAVEDEAIPPAVSLTGQLIARWLGEPPYLGEDGNPRRLPRSAPEGGVCFDALVRSVTADIRPRAVLDDWIDQGFVQVGADGLIALQAAAFLPKPGSEAQLFYFARNLHDHIAAAAGNVGGAQPPALERAVHYDRLPPAVAEKLERAGRAAAQAMLVELNRQALAWLAEHGEAPPGTLTRRVNLGVYLHAEDEAPRNEGGPPACAG